MVKKVYDLSGPIRLVERGRARRAVKSIRPPTSNNAHLNLKQVAVLLTAEGRKELRKTRA